MSALSVDIEDRIEELKEISGKSDNKNTALYVSEKKSELISLLNLQSKIKTLIDTWHDSEYITERVAKGVNFMPLKVDRLSNHIFDYAYKVILMSATIIDPSNFCKTLGIRSLNI